MWLSVPSCALWGGASHQATPSSSAFLFVSDGASKVSPATRSDQQRSKKRGRKGYRPQKLAQPKGSVKEKTTAQAPVALPKIVQTDPLPLPDTHFRPVSPDRLPKNQTTPTVAILLTHVAPRAATLSLIQDRVPSLVGLALHPSPIPDESALIIDHLVSKGHEIITMLPLEPLSFPQNDGGAGTLLTGLKTIDHEQRLDGHLKKRPMVRGIMPFLGSRFLGSKSDMVILLDALKKRQLMYVDPAPLPSGVAIDLCPNQGSTLPACIVSGLRLPGFFSLGFDGNFTDLVLKIHRLGSVLLYAENNGDNNHHMDRLMTGLRASGIQIVPLSLLPTYGGRGTATGQSMAP